MRRRGVCNWHQRGVASYDACARGKEEGGGGAACLSAQLHRRRARWSSLGGRTLLGRELTAAHLQRHGAAPQLLLLVREAVLDQPDLRRRGWGVWEACGRRVGGVWEGYRPEVWRGSGVDELHSRVGGGRGGRTMASTPSSSTVCSSTVCARPSAALHMCCVTVSSASLR